MFATRRVFMIAFKTLAALLSLLVLLVSGWVCFTYNNFTASITHGAPLKTSSLLTSSPDSSKGIKKGSFPAENILLLGNDSRAGASPAELRALSTLNDGGSSNTDTMMLLHLPAGGDKATAISFPRDSYVVIPGHGSNKLNAAYPLAYAAAKSAGKSDLSAQSDGIALLAATLEQLTGLRIDHYLEINLLGFYRISNAIGGVSVCLNAAQKDSFSGIDLPKGFSTISGTQALAFVRQRHGLPNGDLDRIKRQQYFLSAVFSKIVSDGVLFSFTKVNKLLKAVSSSLFTDPSLSLTQLASRFQDLAAGNVVFTTIPTEGFGNNEAGSVVLVNPSKVASFASRLFDASGKAFSAAVLAPASKIVVSVLNGGVANGSASLVASELKSIGFKIKTVSSVSNFSDNTILYPSGLESSAKTLYGFVPDSILLQDSSVSIVTLVVASLPLKVAKPIVSKSSSPSSPAPIKAKNCIN